MFKKLIVTADDYGYMNHIDEGIIAAVKANRVSTVSCFTNIPLAQLKAKIKKLQAANPAVGIGVHLTITSHQPLTHAPSLTSIHPQTQQTVFTPVRQHRLRKINLAALKTELLAQIEQLAKIIGLQNIDHLNNHHHLLYLHQPFFDILTDLAASYCLPIRSPMRWSGNKPVHIYAEHKKALLKLPIQQEAIKSFPLRNALLSVKAALPSTAQTLAKTCASKKVKHPHLFMDQIYGQPYLKDWKDYWQQIDQGEIVEQIMHLSEKPQIQDYQQLPSGLNNRYFEGRYQEFNALMSTTYKNIFADAQQANIPLKLGTYKDFLMPITN